MIPESGLKYRSKEAVLAIAASQIGIMENPSGSNKQKYGTTYGLNGQPWCQIFVWWVMREAGFSFYKNASCTNVVNQYKTVSPKQWKTSDYKPGDIVYFDWTGKQTSTVHVGFVEKVSEDGRTLTTIEGNTAVGNESNGGCVMRRTRNIKWVTGAIRPTYK